MLAHSPEIPDICYMYLVQAGLRVCDTVDAEM